ncbi:aquaporin-8-like [Glandiceps talaboti]
MPKTQHKRYSFENSDHLKLEQGTFKIMESNQGVTNPDVHDILESEIPENEIELSAIEDKEETQSNTNSQDPPEVNDPSEAKVDIEDTVHTKKWTAPKLMENVFRPLFAEFYGTMLLVFVSSLFALYPYPQTDRSKVDPGAELLLIACNGFLVMILMIGIGRVSGGHYNPIVTLGITCVGAMPPLMAFLYVICQVLGAMLGSVLVKAVLTPAQYDFILGGALLVPPWTDPVKALACEWILGMILISTALSALVEPPPSPLGPVAIGFIIALCILAGGKVSGAGLNPARFFGPAVVYGVWTNHWVYWVGPCGGSISSAIIYKLVLASKDKRFILKLKTE